MLSNTGDEHDRHRAMYLYNLVRNIDWHSQDIVIGVVGESQVTTELESLAKKNTKVTIKTFADFDSIENCDIVFLPNATHPEFYQVQQKIGSSSVMLIVDKKIYVARGAEMGFYIEDDQLRFVVNPDAIKETGIKVSQTILQKAVPIR